MSELTTPQQPVYGASPVDGIAKTLQDIMRLEQFRLSLFPTFPVTTKANVDDSTDALRYGLGVIQMPPLKEPQAREARADPEAALSRKHFIAAWQAHVETSVDNPTIKPLVLQPNDIEFLESRRAQVRKILNMPLEPPQPAGKASARARPSPHAAKHRKRF